MPTPEELTVPLPDGRHLAATARGAGRPLVVFEAGLGGARHSWDLVVPEVAERTRCVAYDRAGLGESPEDPEPRTLARSAADLAALLRHLDDGPAVLVAHSYGGPIVRQLLATEPDLVAGLVLVDQTDEGCDLYFTKAMATQGAIAERILPVLGKVGLAKVIAGRLAKDLPPDVRAAVVAESGSAVAARTQGRELGSTDRELRHLRDHPHPATDRPVTLITGTAPAKGKASAAQRAGLLAGHQARAASLAHGRHVRAERSGHLVPFTEPELVAAEVLRLVDELPGA